MAQRDPYFYIQTCLGKGVPMDCGAMGARGGCGEHALHYMPRCGRVSDMASMMPVWAVMSWSNPLL